MAQYIVYKGEDHKYCQSSLNQTSALHVNNKWRKIIIKVATSKNTSIIILSGNTTYASE